ncbi:uncharacterized protein LOC135828142 [Sycon ciliatum]|uniref:uncharacterized protein LOC135828142 n=1 Tax=Sycon ciliatum TaxID=27933 RepID=UPI0031F66670
MAEAASSKPKEDQSVRKAEEDLLVVRKMKKLATNLCEPVINNYQVCLVKEGFLKTQLRLACTKEKKYMVRCIDKIAQDEEIFEDCRRVYVQARSHHNDARSEWKDDKRSNELVDAYRRDQAKVAKDQESLLKDIPGS